MAVKVRLTAPVVDKNSLVENRTNSANFGWRCLIPGGDPGGRLACRAGPETTKPGAGYPAPGLVSIVGAIGYRSVATVVKMLIRLVPTACMATIAATAISAAIRPYSIAVAPESSRTRRARTEFRAKRAFNKPIIKSPWLTGCVLENPMAVKVRLTAPVVDKILR